MRVRKHTKCSQCGRHGHYDLIELMWRLRGQGPWSWCSGFLCGSCRVALFDFIGQLGTVVVALDG